MASQKDKVYMPAGIGGLMRYSEEEQPVIKIKPRQIIWVVAGVVVVELLLKFFF